MNRFEQVWIGAASGFAGDRHDAARPLIEALKRHDGPRYLIFETLAERTLALAQIERRSDPSKGEIGALDRLFRPVFEECLRNQIKVVSNFGGANPLAAATKIRKWAVEAGLIDLKIMVVLGDDLRDVLTLAQLAQFETEGAALQGDEEPIAVNAYLGAEPIAKALSLGADVVVTGRVTDSALVLGPLTYSFGWASDDWDKLAAGILAGHLLECGSQITGGYFADPGVKDVPNLAEIGYPIAEVNPDGAFVVTKPNGTGGVVDRRTVTEQILYEIHDPTNYITPDVILDLSDVEITSAGYERILVSGARGRPAPSELKATAFIEGGFLAEGEISYAGPNAKARARLAASTVLARLAKHAPELPIRVDLIGIVSTFGDSAGYLLDRELGHAETSDIRVRFAAETPDRKVADLLLDEVEALYCAGPAGGGGVRRRLVPRLKSTSCLIPRVLVDPHIQVWEVS